MPNNESTPEYAYADARMDPDPPHQPLYLEKVLAHLCRHGARTVLDAGCGDGNFTASLSEHGYEVFGIDMSSAGISIAQGRGAGTFAEHSLYEQLLDPFAISIVDAVIAVEVIEHLYSPRTFLRRAYEALPPGGLLIITTPYWGYAKNIVLSVTGRLDRMLTALWDGGHIKHWSRKTLTAVVEEAGFITVEFQGAGRPVPFLWSGMMMTFQKPGAEKICANRPVN